MLIHSPKELALFVNSQRKHRKLSQAALGKLVGLKQSTVSAFENTPESTKLETLFQILAAANLDIRISARDETPVTKNQWKQGW
jgi:HTH-type transcriptional regulator / antitoxin HipB